MEVGQNYRQPPPLQTPDKTRPRHRAHPKKDLPAGTVNSIKKQAGLK
nr:type II toxin-antitoxin system HicA family toxin [Laribacter hongkongensis]